MKTQKDRTLEWLDKRLESIERDIMYNVHLIKDKRYERGAIAALKDLSKAHTACQDSIIAVKHMYEELEDREDYKLIYQMNLKNRSLRGRPDQIRQLCT